MTADLSYLNTAWITAGDLNANVHGGAPAGIAVGQPWSFAPKWTYHLAAQYDIGLPDMSDITLRADYGHVSSYQRDSDPARQNPTPEPGYGLLNARIEYTPPDAHWNVQLFGTNLTDSAYVDAGRGWLYQWGWNGGSLGPRRLWGVRVAVDF